MAHDWESLAERTWCSRRRKAKRLSANALGMLVVIVMVMVMMMVTVKVMVTVMVVAMVMAVVMVWYNDRCPYHLLPAFPDRTAAPLRIQTQ